MTTLQIKAQAYTTIETQCTGVASSKIPSSLKSYGGNILGATIQSNNNGEHVPKPKIRIPKKHSNKPLINLDENLFSQAPNNYVTTKSILEESMSHRIERNYSYIEAMKEDIPYSAKTVAKNHNITNKSETLPQNYKNVGKNNRLELTLQPHEFINNKKKQPFSLPASSSPSTTSSSSSTTSSNYTKQHINNVSFLNSYSDLEMFTNSLA